MFSALWAIANQKAGVALGQAAPYLYSLPAGVVTDIVPYSSPNDVIATVQETSTSSTHFSAAKTLVLEPYTKLFGHSVIVRSSALLAAAAGHPSPAGSIGPAAAAQPSFYSSNCFTPGTQTLSTNDDGELPIATYSGEQLNLETLSSPGCAYTPAPIQTAYHLKELYAKGYTGQGQTIVIFDWCGSSTIEGDANAFSKKFGLPQLDASNFQIIYTPTPSECIQEDQIEINLDIEWAHAIAPGANITLVVPPSAYLQDVDEAQFYAVNYGLGNSMSGSYGSPESETAASYLDTENMIAQIAAISGISMHFSSGDYGDYVPLLAKPTVSAPADSPWAAVRACAPRRITIRRPE